MKQKSTNKAFTLIELLIAMAIIGILATVGLASFRTAQMRGRDAARKSDLKQVSNSLEIYYSDYKKYPTPANSLTFDGTFEFKDANTTYFKKVPKDPGGCTYIYRVSATGDKYQLFAHIENTQDKNIDPTIVGVSCGAATCGCNFAITSPNTIPTESL